MAIEIDNKVYRNLPEQVMKNKEDIADLKTKPEFDPSELEAELAQISNRINEINSILSGKVDKVTTTTGVNRVYAISQMGTQTTLNCQSSPNGGAIAMRDIYGRTQVEPPSAAKDAANKQYVDAKTSGGGGTKLYKHRFAITSSYIAIVITTTATVVTTDIPYDCWIIPGYVISVEIRDENNGETWLGTTYGISNHQPFDDQLYVKGFAYLDNNKTWQTIKYDSYPHIDTVTEL